MLTGGYCRLGGMSPKGDRIPPALRATSFQAREAWVLPHQYKKHTAFIYVKVTVSPSSFPWTFFGWVLQDSRCMARGPSTFS